jgi:hypothetical protein
MKLTPTRVANLKPGDVAWDEALPGFGIRVGTLKRSWLFQYRTPRTGKSHRMTLGTFPATPLAAASSRAIDTRTAVERGGNPAEERAQKRQTPTLCSSSTELGPFGALS